MSCTKELNRQERKLLKERNILVNQLKLMNEQLNNLEVERMQILQNSSKNKKISQKSEGLTVLASTTKTVNTSNNMDNESEINNIPVSLNVTSVLKDMLNGQFTVYKNEDMEIDDD